MRAHPTTLLEREGPRSRLDSAPASARSERLQKIIAIAFDEIGAHRLWLDVFAGNDRARHVYRTAGFKEEGVLREAVLQDGRWRFARRHVNARV